MTPHTPTREEQFRLPWKVVTEDRTNQYHVMDEQANIVANDCGKENADYIVKCINSHEALVAVIREFIHCLEWHGPATPGTFGQRVEQALTAAGETV